MDSDIQQSSSTTSASTAVAPQIRSRITVVCAECKRLKLKCDRRNPCGSCQKRDTVSRCIYSPAAAEKVDLHSLNNRLIQVEATLAQLTSGQFMPSYPFSNSSSSNGAPPPTATSPIAALNPPTIQHSSLAIPLEEISGTWLNEFDLGFSLPAEYSKDDLATVKVEPHPVDIPNSLSGDYDDFDMTDRPGTSSSSSSSVNQAPTTSVASPNLASLSISSPIGYVQLPPSSLYYSSSPPFSSPTNTPQLTPALIALLPSLNTYLPTRQVSPQLSLLTYLTLAEESSAHTYPFLNWKTLRERALELLMNARPSSSSPASNARDKEMAREKDREMERDKKERDAAQARQLFMGSSSSRRPVFGNSGSMLDVTMEDFSSQPPRSLYRSETSEDDGGRSSASSKVVEGIPFFAVLCAAIALGALEAEKRASKVVGRDDNQKGASKPRSKPKSSPDSLYWYCLCNQAIGVWDASVAVAPVLNEASPTSTDSNDNRQAKEDQQHEMDYITSCLLQLTFLSKEGLNDNAVADSVKLSTKEQDCSPRKGSSSSKDLPKLQIAKGVAAVMFPLVGKLVNYARQMSLNKDPEDIGFSQAETGFSTSQNSTASGLPPGTKKARSNSKLSDSSTSANLSASKAVRESRYTLYEAEIRRRAWWTIMYYDLFVSDIMNQPPLIADNSFNTKPPVANVDEKAFGPTSTRIPAPADGGEDGTGYSKDGMRYFEIRTRLTMLVRSIKRRMNTPEFGHAQVRTSYYGACSNGHCYSIDQAASMEAEVRAWLNDLPAYYQLDGDINRNTTGAEPTLIAQRCEVAMTAHRLVLRVYLPFLKKHAAGVPHQASLGSVNAAHGIMKAAMALSELWKQQGSSIPSSLTPALFDFYPFSRCVFDAAVVCAHAVIKQPSTVWAATAMEDVDVALGILKGVPASRFGSGVGAAYVVSSSDCIRIVEALKSNAEGGEGSRRGASPNVPSKRKHHEVDDHRSSSPPPTPAYVYPTVSTTAISPSGQEFPQTSPSATHMQSRRQLPFAVVDKGKIDPSSTSPKGSDKDKKVKKNYPVVGVRKRAPKDNLPFAQVPVVQPPNMISNTSTTLPGSRRQSVSTPVAEKPNPVSVSGRTMYPTSHQPTSAATQPPPFQSPNIPQLQAAAAQEQFAYRSRSSSLSQDPRLHMQRPRRDSTLSTSTDYPMATHAPPEDEHAVLSASSGSPQNTISSEMHLGSSISSRQHNVQQAYVESPTSYDTPLDQNASFEYPFHQQSAVEAFNNTRSSSLNAAPDAYPSSSNSYGTASSSGGAMPTSSPGSSYTNPASTVAYSPQTHQTNSSSFNQKNNAPQSRGYYDTTGMYENYNNPSGAGQAGIMHGDMVQSVISGTMDDSMMFDQVSYDIKPSMEELNDQHRQHTYQAYNSDHRSQSQLHNAVSSSQVWTTLPQTGHVPDGATSYWSDTSIPPDNRPFYQT